MTAPENDNVITPTVGRIVWFMPVPGKEEVGQPHAAIVAYVHDDRCVNLHVFGQQGQGVNFHEKVQLLQGSDEPKDLYTPVCMWMPYQLSKAKTEKAETAQSATLPTEPPAPKQEDTPPPYAG